MKEWMLEFLNAQLGRVLLGIVLLWTAWVLIDNWYTPLPENLTKVEDRPVYVELDTSAKLADEKEVYYSVGDPGPYSVPGIFAFHAEEKVVQFNPVDLDIPTISVKRPPQILPEPGPSLEGSDKLPRFGDEFAPPAASDLNPATPPKTGAPK